MDIRKYFTSKGATSGLSSQKKDRNAKKQSSEKGKRKIRGILDSDSDEDDLRKAKIPKSEEKIKKERKPKKKIEESPKLKPTSAKEFFGSGPVSRKEGKIFADKTKLKENKEVHSDDDFMETLHQLDSQNIKEIPEKQRSVTKPSPRKQESVTKPSPRKHQSASESSPKKQQSVTKSSPKKHTDSQNVTQSSPKRLSNHKPVNTKSPKDEITPSQKLSMLMKKKSAAACNGDHEQDKNVIQGKGSFSKCEHTPSKVEDARSSAGEDTPNKPSLSDSVSSLNDSLIPETPDPLEKRKQNAQHYRKYLERQGPANPGSKEIPKGAPGCLQGLTFVVTGVMESLERNEMEGIIKEYGGKATSNISKNTSYVIIGREPGPKKIEKAEKLKTKQLDEDGFLELLRSRPGKEEKPEKFTKIKDRSAELKEKTPKKSTEAKRQSESSQEKSSKKKKIEHEDRSNVDIEEKSFARKELKLTETKEESKHEDLKPQNLLWVDKYAPTTTKQIIGQQGDMSNMRKLKRWLESWYKNRDPAKKHVRPSPWAKSDDGSFFKAALLSGPPGVGKTTTSYLVCKECDFDIVEMNASDTRSKRLIGESFADMISTKSLYSYATAENKSVSSRHVLLMDEVDGMAGNEDRGGVGELINLIKSSKVPIICMCNDRNHPKIRSLANYCFDLRFQRPRVEQIKAAMMTICFKEGLKVKPEAITELINGADQDIRQVIHHLSVWSSTDKALSTEQAKQDAQKAKKDFKMGPWDVCRKVFSASDHKSMSLQDKSNLFFQDYSFGPMFVQENYPSVVPQSAKGSKNKTLVLLSKAADSIAEGDIVSTKIRNQQAWGLLPTQAMFSSVLPGEYLSGYMSGQIQFPSWFGKNSRQKKCDRILQEIQMHMRLKISGSKHEVNEDYLHLIKHSITDPLIKRGSEGVRQSIDFLDNYYLLRDDLEGIVELSVWPGGKDPMSQVDSKVKAAFTRTYNKEGRLNPYSQVSISKLKKKATSTDEYGEDEEVASDSEQSDVENDNMIKATKSKSKKVEQSKPSTSSKGKQSKTAKPKATSSKRKK